MSQSSVQGKSRKKLNKCKCGKIKELEWHGNGVQYPVFSCPDCGVTANYWEKWWDEYKDLCLDINNWEQPKHMISCIVGYFCTLYNQVYGYPYSFSYASPNPYRDKDFIMARRLLAAFNGKARVVGNYLKWVFKTKIEPKRYKVTSLGFFTTSNIINEYKHARARAQTIRRTTRLPEEFLQWCREHEPEIFELQELNHWNDLNGLVTHIKCYGEDSVEGRVAQEAVNRKMLPPGPDYRKLEE